MPELSALEPLEFDEQSQRLVARGDAILDFRDTRVRADRITYYQEYGLADAEGNVAITQNGNRLIAERLSYEAGKDVFAVDLLRTGQWPFHISGVSAGGTTEDISLEGATLYYGEPGPFALNVSSDQVEYVDEEAEYVKMQGATFRVGNIPVFYLPGYTHYLDNSPYYLDLAAGHDGELGGYLQSTAMFPVSSFMRLGANLDLYSKRGALVGPAAQYVYDSENQQIVGALSTGWIEDQGDDDELGRDIVGQQIDSSRGFAEWRHKHHIGERISLTANASYWSDSEVTRDFRDDYYDRNQTPDNFAEAAYAGDNFIVSAFGRFRPNDFVLTQERLPELRFDLLPVPILNTGAYHKASASYVQLRERFDSNAPALSIEGESDRYDLNYRVQRPISPTSWLTFTPLAGARFTGYDNQRIDPFSLADDSFTRDIYELGFDLEMRAYRSYDTVNKTWNVDGLRHIVRPVIRYRYYSDPEDLNEIAAIDRDIFDLERPLLDLSELRNIDQISERHLTRIGFENLFQTRAEGYGSRTLAALNFYQDVLFDKETRFDGSEEETLNATWVELVMEPAPWLKFELASRFRTESLTMEELRTRTILRSGEIWELGLSTDLLNKRIDQYRLDFIYRINERNAVLTDLRYDADSGELTRFGLGWRSRVGSTWQIIYYLTFREGARRESDVEFGVSVSLAEPDPEL
ncbi:MAG TPA: LPS assembly protein LptD [Opitutales bacterium]|nr:LPS assembly protein LptD [Opitutales bacterium]